MTTHSLSYLFLLRSLRLLQVLRTMHHLSVINIEHNPIAALTLPLFVDHLTLLYVNEPKIHV